MLALECCCDDVGDWCIAWGGLSDNHHQAKFLTVGVSWTTEILIRIIASIVRKYHDYFFGRVRTQSDTLKNQQKSPISLLILILDVKWCDKDHPDHFLLGEVIVTSRWVPIHGLSGGHQPGPDLSWILAPLSLHQIRARTRGVCRC